MSSEVDPEEIPNLFLYVFLEVSLHVEIHYVYFVLHMAPEIKVTYKNVRQACQTQTITCCSVTKPFLELPDYHLWCGKLLHPTETAHMIILYQQSAWRNILTSVRHIYLDCFFTECEPNSLFFIWCTSNVKFHIMKMNFLD